MPPDADPRARNACDHHDVSRDLAGQAPAFSLFQWPGHAKGQAGSNTHPETARDIIQRCDPGGPERWAAERARSHPYGLRDKRSHAPGCTAALAATRTMPYHTLPYHTIPYHATRYHMLPHPPHTLTTRYLTLATRYHT